MTWTQGRPAAEGPAEPEQEAPGLPRLPQGRGSPGLVPAGLEPWGSLRGGHRRGWSSSPGLSSARDGRGAEGPESDTAGRCLSGSDLTVMDSVHQDPPLAFRAFSSTSDIHIKCGWPTCCQFPLQPVTTSAAAKSLQSCPTLCNPIVGSPPGSTIPRILQARTLKWVAISSSNA